MFWFGVIGIVFVIVVCFKDFFKSVRSYEIHTEEKRITKKSA